MSEEQHVLSADCPCGPEVEEVGATEPVFNTFPDKSDDDLRRIALVAKARAWQALGELSRRLGDSPLNSPLIIEAAQDKALTIVLYGAFRKGEFASEHDALQSIIDNNGTLTPPSKGGVEVAV